MRSHDDLYVHCPFNYAHVMPHPRLQWHLAKCPAKVTREKDGLPTYRCFFNSLHIYIDKEKLKEHESNCSDDPSRAKKRELDQITHVETTDAAQ